MATAATTNSSRDAIPSPSSSLTSLYQNVSSEQIEHELTKTQQALALATTNNPDRPSNHDATPPLPNPLAELGLVEQQANDLLLAKDVAWWMESEQTRELSESFSLVHEASACERLGQLLRRHKCPTSNNNNNDESSLYSNLYRQEFLPTYDYVRTMLVLELRKGLRHANYPSHEGCAQLLHEYETETTNDGAASFSRIAATAEWLHRLTVERDLVNSHVQGTSPATSSQAVDDVVLELCRPFVEKIRHHFVEGHETDRIDRLPEWIFAYVREQVFPDATDGPWEFIHYGLTPRVRPGLSLDFVNEMIRLIQWVFGQRNVFRHGTLCGDHSQPVLLCQAIEQLLQFDEFLNRLTGRQSGRVLSFMDIYVAGDEELLHWWLEREREAVFDSLLHGKVLDNNKQNDTLPTCRVSPRAELFCSLLRSMKRKATVFSFSGPYLSHVAAPLCLHFLDAVQDSASTLKTVLFPSRRVPTAREIQSHVTDWIQLINGTHQSAQLLLHNDDDEPVTTKGARSAAAHHDLDRFGQSLERLKQVLVDEFATQFVEHVLLEKAKLASYLMRASHLLATYNTDDDDNNMDDELSPDLADTHYVLTAFLQAVQEEEDSMGSIPRHVSDPLWFASRALRDRVLTVISEKFLEVALDWHGTTPEVSVEGARVFGSDLAFLVGDTLVLPPTAMRLLNVTQCLAMPASQLSVMGDALSGLAGQPPPLTEDMFAMDERVYEEAMSMIAAKNILFLQLGDFLSILNRRHDLSYVAAY